MMDTGFSLILCTHMAVIASFWKVTNAIPNGFLLTFSFSFLYSSFSFASSFV